MADMLQRRLMHRFGEPSPLPIRVRLMRFLESIRDSMEDPIESAALRTVIFNASRSEDAASRLENVTNGWLTFFRSSVGNVSPEDFAQLVGPLFSTRLIAGAPITDKLVLEQMRLGVEIVSKTWRHRAHPMMPKAQVSSGTNVSKASGWLLTRLEIKGHVQTTSAIDGHKHDAVAANVDPDEETWSDHREFEPTIDRELARLDHKFAQRATDVVTPRSPGHIR